MALFLSHSEHFENWANFDPLIIPSFPYTPFHYTLHFIIYPSLSISLWHQWLWKSKKVLYHIYLNTTSYVSLIAWGHEMTWMWGRCWTLEITHFTMSFSHFSFTLPFHHHSLNHSYLCICPFLPYMSFMWHTYTKMVDFPFIDDYLE